MCKGSQGGYGGYGSSSESDWSEDHHGPPGYGAYPGGQQPYGAQMQQGYNPYWQGGRRTGRRMVTGCQRGSTSWL